MNQEISTNLRSHNDCKLVTSTSILNLFSFPLTLSILFFYNYISISSKEKNEKQMKKNHQSHVSIKLVEAYSTLFDLQSPINLVLEYLNYMIPVYALVSRE